MHRHSIQSTQSITKHTWILYQSVNHAKASQNIKKYRIVGGISQTGRIQIDQFFNRKQTEKNNANKNKYLHKKKNNKKIKKEIYTNTIGGFEDAVPYVDLNEDFPSFINKAFEFSFSNCSFLPLRTRQYIEIQHKAQTLATLNKPTIN